MLNRHFPALLDYICQGGHLAKEQSFDQFSNLIEGKLSVVEMAAFLIALKAKGETKDEVLGAILAMQKHAFQFPGIEALKEKHSLVDCAGTGGDKQNTLNISTATAIILSCAGMKVAKSGNRAISSKSGTADIFEQLGLNFSNSLTHACSHLEQVGLSFLFAPLYNPAAKIISEIRHTLKVRTIFNFIGPISNPMQPEYRLIGVFDPKLCHDYVKLLQIMKTKRALVIHGSGLDEIAIHGETRGYLLKEGEISPFRFHPRDIGLKEYQLSDILGQDVAFNSKALLDLLSGKGTTPYRACVAVNVAAILWMVESVTSLREGYEQAQDIMSSNVGENQLHRFIEVTNHVK
jgi:anthranilate phosphoribosyltransferase